MRVLLIGSGGREHALAWKICQSKRLEKLYIAPGNGGTQLLGENISLNISNHAQIIKFCRDKNIDLVIIGPEAPLVEGIVDSLQRAKIKVFGPTREAAMLEGSKIFSKKICKENNIPTANYIEFDEERAAINYLKEQKMPIVIKADGLAAGKGVVIAKNFSEGKQAIKNCFGGTFGAAGKKIIIEEYLEGEEVSIFAICDGENFITLASAQDHKRAFDNDEGPNTGGMGAYSPAPIIDNNLSEKINEKIILPTIRAMKKRGTPFTGILFAGLMIVNGKKEAKLIEYNVRFGDPECQVLMLRLENDLLDIIEAAISGKLANIKLAWKKQSALCVVMAAKGYPGEYKKGSVIENLQNIENENIKIFHAGTKRMEEKFLANGGRVLNIVALGDNVAMAQNRAYQAIRKIDWKDGFFRSDIGFRAIEEKNKY